MFDKEIARLQEMVDETDNMVFFGGAGVSTESGIPDFRSVDGLYHQTYAYPPETILSHSFYLKNKEEFYRFYHDKMLIDLYHGRKLVLINRDETPADARADLVIHGSIGEILSRIAVR